MIAATLAQGQLTAKRGGGFEVAQGPRKQAYFLADLAPTLRSLRPTAPPVLVRFLSPEVAQLLREKEKLTDRVVVWPPDAVPPEIEKALRDLNAASAAASATPTARVDEEDTAPRRRSAGTAAFFTNPYSFVPFPPRPPGVSDFSDAAPASHALHKELRFSVRLVVQMETVTPLLVSDGARKRMIGAEPKQHTVMPTRMLDGQPLIPQTSVRGMLRSAYEAVTNSRLPFNGEHGSRLGLRMPAEEALAMVPARVVSRDGRLALQLLWGNQPHAPIFRSGRFFTPGDEMYAAWLPFRFHTSSLRHGQRVFFRFRMEKKEDARGRVIFQYPLVTQAPRPAPDGEAPTAGEFEGYVCVNNHNIGGKAHERVFFRAAGKANGPLGDHPALPDGLPLTERLAREWAALIGEARVANAQRMRNRGSRPHDEYRGPDINDVALSRHLYEPGVERLKVGDLVYVRFDREGAGQPVQVSPLSPVLIGRELYREAPAAFVDPSVAPATSRKLLSPADRVFGWVGQDGGSGAHKGHLRIGPVTPAPGQGDLLEHFTDPAAEGYGHGDGLPLAILAEPKPAQARFYAARDREGRPFDDAVPKRLAYQDPRRQGLRGRKIYPHHDRAAATPGYWAPPRNYVRGAEEPVGPDNGPKLFREYLRVTAKGQAAGQDPLRDNQNRSVLSWVKPNSRFEFEIRATNLSAAELGALLWLLALPQDHALRLGGGKPLGFGSVRLSLRRDRSVLLDHSAIVARYATPLGRADGATWSGQIEREALTAFERAATALGGTPNFDELPTIAAFRNAAAGTGRPVHYPRVFHPSMPPTPHVPPDPAGESFRWFVANEARDGHGFALPPGSTRERKELALEAYRLTERDLRR